MKKGDEELNSKEHLRTHSGYIIGIVAIVLAIFNPLPGIVLGIVGLVQSAKQKNAVSNKAKKFNVIAIILGVAILVASILLADFLTNVIGSGY